MSGKQAANRDQDRTRAHQPRTISTSRLERGQTTQDFVVGIGVFLLAIAFVFSFFPALVTPYDSSVGGAETAQADRIADRIVNDTSTGTPNELDENGLDPYNQTDLTAHLGLRSSDGTPIDNVNVTVTNISDGETVTPTANWTGGENYENQSAASSARIVTIENSDDKCDPACRLIVKVW
ncbi:hypothetical protein [Natrinema hispanicum]|uniref:Uncharacterized protein n=1 Tax=Natrinema hispanicum TaxID=392421 RepID=A0A1G6U855_9EURY|nr:hypothetical protein [Natrinema hispanicum]SDD37483.1 hypothetical protein SAMN05192552_102038 [Natrinema hispanicum]SET66198.1 hypothetical protein SAMN04488694_1106 [Natrinema hispanicum]